MNRMRKDLNPRYSNIRVSLINSGRIFGLEDVQAERDYTVSVKCQSTEASCYSIPSAEFFHLVRHDEKTQRMLKEIGEMKKEGTSQE